MTKGLGLRQYRACVRCRSRKTRCDLQGIGDPSKPPCVKCVREGAECVLATSRRGGNYSHIRRLKKQLAPELQRQEELKRLPRPEPVVSISSPENISLHSTTPGDHVHDNLQNPSDALLILAHAAGQPENQSQSRANSDNPYSPEKNARSASRHGGRHASIHDPTGNISKDIGTIDEATFSHPLIDNGSIHLPLILELLSLYRESYHPFFPLVPANVLKPENIQETLQKEPFLTTAILVIASKDRPDLATLHNAIWDYLRQRILDVVLGVSSTRHVGCVEALLLLGEWTLLNFGQADDGGGEAAWSLLGLAVRLAYRLRLEDSGFRGEDNELDPVAQRKRLAWTFTYLSDRQISIRMGQAFWCRGPALSVRFIAQDFPSLQPQSASDEDYASWIQAQVELTTLFGNAHDILFASKSRTIELITRGDYVKYIDDTGKAMAAWQRAWSGITVSRALRGCLASMQEYLRLYVNAFAFQAVLYRASRVTSNPSPGPGIRAGSRVSDLDFPDSTMASADARHIYEALDAAESLLRIFTEEFEEGQLRCMPARFYLYEIHSSVFLYKAHASGAISPSRYTHTTTLIQRFITLLQTIAIDEQHIASRYARLLHQLWFQRPHSATGPSASEKSGVGLEARDALGTVGGFGADSSYGASVVDEVGLGLEAFEGMEGMDGFFAMPPVFPYDLSMFFRQVEGAGFAVL